MAHVFLYSSMSPGDRTEQLSTLTNFDLITNCSILQKNLNHCQHLKHLFYFKAIDSEQMLSVALT